MEDYNQELINAKVREKLNSDKIKLWLPPYTTEVKEKGELPLDLIKKYSADLLLDEEIVANTLECMRVHALNKLSERDKFQSTGVAVIKVKLTSQQPVEKRQILSVEIALDKTGIDLKQLLSQQTSLDINRIKLIASGKIVADNITLSSQGLKNGSQVLLITLASTDVILEDQDISAVAKTRKAAELLSTRAEIDDETFDVQIADQKGCPLKLPKEEKKSLTLAMSLHEKGRTALKEKNFSRALLLLLEADKEFSNCQADILERVDNYAILSLDIVWCYLCLENIGELPDADRRLHRCETVFNSSYGNNLERLKQIKDGAEAERILLMRLHLLQGIVAFHQHNIALAHRLLNQAMDEFSTLQVNAESVAHLMSIGLTAHEARLGLRSCQGSIERAAEYIMKQRQEREEIKQRVTREREERRKAKKFGKCANGDTLNMHNVNLLVSMNYPRAAAVEALKQANNDVSLAVDILYNHPELLDLPDRDADFFFQLSDTDIAQLSELGFEPSMVKLALKRHRGDIAKAAEDLVKYNGSLPYSSNESLSEESSGSGTSKGNRKKEEENKVLDEFVSDMNHDENDHLDLDMMDEQQFLTNYLARLRSLH